MWVDISIKSGPTKNDINTIQNNNITTYGMQK